VGLICAAAALIGLVFAAPASALTINLAPLVRITIGGPETSPPAQPTITAHRGGTIVNGVPTYAENTLPGFAASAARGDIVEFDVHVTKDGVPIVIHDDTLDRTTNCSGAVVAHTLASLKNCNAATVFPGWPDFEPVPTLRSVFKEGRSAGWRVMVEIKNIPGESNFDPLGTKVAAALVKLVNETHFPASRLIVQSFWPLSLDNVELRAPMIRTALLTSSTLPSLPVGVPVTLNALYATLLRYEISAPDIRTIDMIEPVVTLAHILGREVVTWTPDTVADIDTAIGIGVDGVISNYPDRVYAALDG